jgi:UDP-arabinose 4-epimerase
MRVLVTGGAGFIGSHVCKALSQAGYEPIVFDNLVYGNRDAVKWGPLVEGDILNTSDLDRAFDHHRPQAVMHFAAFAYVGESVTDPLKYYRNNINGTVSLLEAMKRHDVQSIVFSSTCATYGIPDTLPITEATPQRPINPYGYTKLVIEQALVDCARAHGLRYAALRYFNAAGADPDGEIGEKHDPETHALPLAILAALGKGKPFQVFGTDYETPDGTAVRDYIHVSDLASAHVLALRHLAAGGESGAFNLATGQGISVKQLIAAVEAASGRTVPVQYAPRRAGDPPALYASAEKARTVLGWTPRFTEITSCVATAVRWFERHSN